MSAQKHSLQTRDLARFGDQFHIYDFILITFIIFSLYWVFVGKVLEMEPCRSPGDVATLRERLNKPYLMKKQ